MMKRIGSIALLALGVALVLAPTPAGASCGVNISFGQNSGGHAGCGGGYCYVQSPGVRTNSSIQGTYWSVGQGNPAAGAGVDNGTYSDDGWLPDFGFGGGVAISGDWAASLAIDGCPAATGAMAVALSDVDATNGNAFFAAACVTRNGGATTEFDYTTVVPESNIILKPLPAAVITGSVRVGNETTITVASPNFASIYYSDGSPLCAIGAIIPQYDLWVKQIGRGAAAPTDVNQDTGTWVLAGTCNVGSPCSGTTTCGATNCDAFAATTPHYNSNFSTGDAPGKARLAGKSFRFQAGPTFAAPPKFKHVTPGPKKINE